MGTNVIFAQLASDNDGWGHMNGWDGGWMWLWGTLMMLSWVAIIAAAIWFVSGARDRTSTPGGTRARQILNERYAHGELTTDEYRERLDHLT